MAMYRQFQNIEVPMFLLTSGWQDCSYGNDACPRSERKLDPGQESDYPLIRMWVEEDDVALREHVSGHKFVAELVSSESDDLIGKVTTLYEGEDAVQAQIAILNAPRVYEKLQALKMKQENTMRLTVEDVPNDASPRVVFMQTLRSKLTNYSIIGNDTLYSVTGATKSGTIVAKIYVPLANMPLLTGSVIVSIMTRSRVIDSKKFVFFDYSTYLSDSEIKLLAEKISDDIVSYIHFWRYAYGRLSNQEG